MRNLDYSSDTVQRIVRLSHEYLVDHNTEPELDKKITPLSLAEILIYSMNATTENGMSIHRTSISVLRRIWVSVYIMGKMSMPFGFAFHSFHLFRCIFTLWLHKLISVIFNHGISISKQIMNKQKIVIFHGLLISIFFNSPLLSFANYL